ncbi:MAG: CPBP family intramembrane glutamic endopeptidase [Actinomycetota bacterium]
MRSPYGLWIATFSVLIFMAPNLAVLAAGGLAEGLEGGRTVSSPELVFSLAVTLVFQIGIFLAALLPLLAAGRPYTRLLGPTRGTAVMWAVGLGVGVATSLAALGVNASLALLLEADEPVEQQVLQDALAGGAPLVLAALIAVIVAPVTEEAIFRGVLFRALAGRLGTGVGMVLSAAVFALIHLEILFSQPIALSGLFVVGVALAVAYHLTGSLVVPIVGHAVFNAVSLMLALLIDRLGLDELEQVATLVASTVRSILVALGG